jgi:hypothetical protein
MGVFGRCRRVSWQGLSGVFEKLPDLLIIFSNITCSGDSDNSYGGEGYSGYISSHYRFILSCR